MFCHQFRAETVTWLCCYKQQKISYFHVINENIRILSDVFFFSDSHVCALVVSLFIPVVSEYIFCTIDISSPYLLMSVYILLVKLSFVVCWGSKCGVCCFVFFSRTGLYKSIFSYIKPRFTYI